MMTITFDDVVKNQKELAEYQEKVAKDKELLETFDKQVEVKLDTAGINNGDTIRENQQAR